MMYQLRPSQENRDHINYFNRENLIQGIGYTEDRRAEKPKKAMKSPETVKSRKP